MTQWRIARALLVFRAEVDAVHPNRDRASDGFIGDAAHATHNSDHNPWVLDRNGVGVVRAWDCDAGPGLNPNELHDTVGDSVARCARQAGLKRHPAMGPGAYVIHERRIASEASSPRWTWRPYAGPDPHTSHPHISVGVHHYDTTASWSYAPAPKPPKAKPKHPPGSRVLHRGMHTGADFHWLARAMGHPTADHFGAGIEDNVRRFQRQHHLPVDGVVGPKTWRVLLRAAQ